MPTFAKTQSAQISLRHWMRSQTGYDPRGGQSHLLAFVPSQCLDSQPSVLSIARFTRVQDRHFDRAPLHGQLGRGLDQDSAPAFPVALLFLNGQIGASQVTTVAPTSAFRPGCPQGAAWPVVWAHWKMSSGHTEKRERSKSER
jgi:hypothetical protein